MSNTKKDSWGRELPSAVDDCADVTSGYQQQLSFNFGTQVRDATDEQIETWYEEDFFMKGDFDVMKLFVFVPAVIQVVVFGMMLAVMYLNTILF